MDWSLLRLRTVRPRHLCAGRAGAPRRRCGAAAGSRRGLAVPALRRVRARRSPPVRAGRGRLRSSPRGKEIRSKLILRLFAIERFLRGIVAVLAVAYALWHFRTRRLSIERAFDRELPLVRDLFRQLGYNIDHSKLVGLLQHALTLSSRTLTLLAAGPGPLRGHRADRGRRAVAGQALGRVLRDDRDLTRAAAGDLRPDPEDHGHGVPCSSPSTWRWSCTW